MIPLFKPIYDVDSCLAQVEECLEKGWTGLGYKTVEFEEAWKEYTKLPHAHFLNSATSGLQLALDLIRTRVGGVLSVVSTPMTFIATNHAIVNATGFKPIFVDIDESLCMCPDTLEERLDKNQEEIDVVVYVGMGGNLGKLNNIAKICEERGIYLILDAAHMAGSYNTERGDIHVGTEANFTVFSFQAVKNLSVGDGGMICCRNKDDDELARKLSWLGISKDTWGRTTSGGNWDYNVEHYGNKYHGNSLTAAIGLAQLEHLEAHNEIRWMIRRKYNNHLLSGYRTVAHTLGHTSSHLYQVRVKADIRDDIIAFARDKGVQLGVHYRINTDYSVYQTTVMEKCPEAELASKELISLPMGPHLGEDDVKQVIEVMNAAIRHCMP